jgi:hypothetical protein
LFGLSDLPLLDRLGPSVPLVFQSWQEHRFLRNGRCLGDENILDAR